MKSKTQSTSALFNLKYMPFFGVAGIAFVLMAAHGGLYTAYAQGTTQRVSIPTTDTQLQKYEREGVAVEFTIESVAREKGIASKLLEGTEATLKFKITDANTGKALNSLRPPAWIDLRDAGAVSDARACREKTDDSKRRCK